MEFSEDADYLEFGRAYAYSKLSDADAAIKKCLEKDYSSLQKSFLYSTVSELSEEMGNGEQAEKYFLYAVATDPFSPMPVYRRAKFLFSRMKKYGQAISLCDVVMAMAHSAEFNDSQGELSAEQYVNVATSLKAECQHHVHQTSLES